jgi:hypothetical protein
MAEERVARRRTEVGKEAVKQRERAEAGCTRSHRVLSKEGAK